MLLNKTSHHTGVANEIYGQDKMVIISQAWIEKIWVPNSFETQHLTDAAQVV